MLRSGKGVIEEGIRGCKWGRDGGPHMLRKEREGRREWPRLLPHVPPITHGATWGQTPLAETCRSVSSSEGILARITEAV